MSPSRKTRVHEALIKHAVEIAAWETTTYDGLSQEERDVMCRVAILFASGRRPSPWTLYQQYELECCREAPALVRPPADFFLFLDCISRLPKDFVLAARRSGPPRKPASAPWGLIRPRRTGPRAPNRNNEE